MQSMQQGKNVCQNCGGCCNKCERCGSSCEGVCMNHADMDPRARWNAKCAGFGPLVLRVVLGIVFFLHGWQKLTMMGVEGTSGFLAGLGFPMPAFFAVVLIAIEVLGGLALIAGIYTRWAAKLGALVALVALFTVHLKNGFFITGGVYGFEFILLILASAVSLMFSGGGRYSLDASMMCSGKEMRKGMEMKRETGEKTQSEN